jgi:hypothetical protein
MQSVWVALDAITSVVPDLKLANPKKECLNQQFFWLFSKNLDMSTPGLVNTDVIAHSATYKLCILELI